MAKSGFEWAVYHPRSVLVACFAIATLGWFGAARLGFEASYTALLPDDSAVVQELEAVKQDLGGGTSDLVLVVSGPAGLRDRLAHELARSLARDPRIARADADMARGFFEDRALYLIERADLDELARRVTTAYRTSIARAMAVLEPDEEDDPESADPWAPVLALRAELENRYARWDRRQVSADGQRRYVFVRPRVAAIQFEEARAVVADIQALIHDQTRALGPDAREVQVELAGWLAIHLAEQDATRRDMRRATLIALFLVIVMLTVVLRRLAAPLVIALPLLLALLLTLAAAAGLVGTLNLLSAFTLPALVGLGIDFGIHLYTRFLAELDDTAPDAADESRPASRYTRGQRAMVRAIRATFRASTTSALTTAAAFASLALVDFRGFREFGMLGAAGVLVTLVTTYTVLPPLALWLTRTQDGTRSRGRGAIDRAQRPSHAAGILAGVVIALAAVATWVAAVHLPGLAFENDFRELRSDAEVIALTESVEDELGLLLNPTVFVVPDLDAARTVEAQARALREQRRADSTEPTIGIAEVGSAARLIPADADQRAEILARMGELLGKTLAFTDGASLEDPDRLRGLQRLFELCQAEPYGVEDLPASVRRRLLAAGSDALIVFVWPDQRLYRDTLMVPWLALIDTLRARVENAIGDERAKRVRVLDERRVPLDVIALIRRDLPRALGLACILVVLALFIHFRRVTVVLSVAGSMALAMVLFLGALAATGIQLDVYNAVVLPCIVGIGIDNAIHIQHAYQRARGASTLRRVLSTTGLAALLSSLTTGIGFGATMIAHQGGLRSMGLTAVLGVGCTLFTTTAVLPAVLHLRDTRRATASSSCVPGASRRESGRMS